jgi:hypothetical protein
MADGFFRARRLRLVLLLVVIVAAGSTSAVLSARPVAAQVQSVDRATAVETFFAAIEANNLDAATATFSEDALFVGTRFCPPPDACTGRAAIRAGLGTITPDHPHYRLDKLIASGSVVFGEAEFRDDQTSAAGVDRILLPFLAEVPATRITSFVALLDTTDPQTAEFLALPPSMPLDRQAMLEQWFEDRGSGNVDGALAELSDDVFLASAPPCTQGAPCIGKDAFSGRLSVPSMDTNRRYIPFGSAIVVQYEQHSAALAAAGIDRIVVTSIVNMPSGKIGLFVRVPDLTDPQTADNAGLQQAPPN